MFATHLVATFLAGVGHSQVTATAYDSACVADLPAPTDPRRPRFPQSLAWLRAHQHADGSWGGEIPYPHDRLLSTLRALLTLHTWDSTDPAIAPAWAYLQAHGEDLCPEDEATIGFELIYPTLLATAAARGLTLAPARLREILAQRAAKLDRAPLHLAAHRDLPLAVNIEGLGARDAPTWAQTAQEAHGSIALSPAATAYLLAHHPANAAAAAYLAAALAAAPDPGAAPACYPIETFERGWALYHLGHAWPALYSELAAQVTPLLTALRATQQAGGWAASAAHSAKEADTTGIVYTVLGRAGQAPDPQVLYQYEEATHFRCYALERNPSISANAHVLDALQYAPVSTRAARIQKLLCFLASARQPAGFWVDKWHASPYYPTCQVILAAGSQDPALVVPALAWLEYTQQADGSWGWAQPTVEETAYALLALAVSLRRGWAGSRRVVARGLAYLWRHGWPLAPRYPPLWLHKALYAPVEVIQSAVLAALLAGVPVAAPIPLLGAPGQVPDTREGDSL